jgi:hypothetical protein
MFRRNSSFILSVDFLRRCLCSDYVTSNRRGWIKNYELERIWKEAILVSLKYYLDTWLQEWGKPRKRSVRAASFTAKIRSKYLPNTSVEPYRQAKQLGVPVCYDVYCLLRCDTVQTGRSLPTLPFYSKLGDSKFLWIAGKDLQDYMA